MLSETGRKSRGSSLSSITRKALTKYATRIEEVTSEALETEPHVVSIVGTLSSKEAYDNTIYALCRANIVVFDVTNYEPAVMMLMGIRSVVRRGLTISSAGGDYVIGDPLDFPFNIKEVNIISHSARQVTIQEPIDILGQRIVEGFRQLRTLPNYLDLPAFEAIRNLSQDAQRWRPRGYKEQVLVLCPFSKDYQRRNWSLYLKRNILVHIPYDQVRSRETEILRTLDMKSPPACLAKPVRGY